MKQSEIDKAVNDWTDGFGGSTVEIAQLKKDVAAISFRAGAEMVNKAQPYSAEDMKRFGIFVEDSVFIDGPNEYWVFKDQKYVTMDELLKLWEETK